jgi:hypothetical protein
VIETALTLVEMALVIAAVQTSRRIAQEVDPGYMGSMGVFTFRGSQLLRDHEQKYPNSSKRTVLLMLVAATLLVPMAIGLTL